VSTPISGLTPYCTVQQFLLRHDNRTIAQWVSDIGIPAVIPDLTTTGTQANNVLLELLGSASGLLESAVMMGNKYSVGDLQAVATQAGNSAKFLASIVADVALYELWDRRPNRDTPIPPKTELAFTWLQKLQDGERIFALQEQADAGRIDHFVEMASDVQARWGTVVQARNFFGTRANQLPPQGGGFPNGTNNF
jgi:hypothetical protein